jgi:hypothetical protein
VAEEDIAENLRRKTVFTASTTPSEKEALLQKIYERQREFVGGTDELIQSYPESFIRREPNPQEITHLERAIDRVRQKLLDAGVPQPDALLPTLNQISLVDVIDHPKSRWLLPSVCGGYGEYIRLFLDPRRSFTLNSPEEAKFYHEALHFLVKVVVEPQPRGDDIEPRLIASGLHRPTPPGDDRPIGIPLEGLADLFASFCRDDIHYCIYILDDAFDIALIANFATRSKITPLDALKKFFRANILRDFSLQKELLTAFGSENVRYLNRIQRPLWEPDYPLVLEDVATKLGFQKDYIEIRQKLTEGKTVNLPGTQIQLAWAVKHH